MKKVLIAAAFCGALAGCTQESASLAPGQVLRISPTVWSWYNQHKVRGKPLYFAVSEDGEFAAGNFCDVENADERCVNEMSWGRRDALSRCEEFSGQGCLIFAQNGQIQVPYEVRP
jgi:hypothetical protein